MNRLAFSVILTALFCTYGIAEQGEKSPVYARDESTPLITGAVGSAFTPSTAIGSVILGMRDDRLISAEVKNPRGHLVARTLYQNHSKMGLNYIPMTVISSTYDATSELLRYEQIVYSNSQMNVEPPNPILNFRIPESVKVQEVKW